MKLIVSNNKIIDNPSKVHVKNYFGDLLKNSRYTIELKKSENERLIFKWERFIGITAQLYTSNKKPEAKDSINFFSYNNAINASLLFLNGNEKWREILKMKKIDDFNFKLLTRSIFKITAIISFIGSISAVTISLLSSIDSSGTLANWLNSNDPTYYPAFAIFLFAIVITEITSIVYRVELEKQQKIGAPPMYLFMIFIVALVFAFLSLFGSN